MIVAIVQARMGSTRLPGKVLADVAGRPLLWHVVARTCRAASIDHVVVATSTAPADDAIVAFCAGAGIECHRGSADDVLDRYYQVATALGCDTVVRITADCPLIDPAVIDLVVGAYREGGSDYVSNTIEYTFPDGLDVEAFSRAALERAWREASSPGDREHVTPYLRRSPAFSARNVTDPNGRFPADWRWTVDEPGDLTFVREVFRELTPEHPEFSAGDLHDLLTRRPDLIRRQRDVCASTQACQPERR